MCPMVEIGLNDEEIALTQLMGVVTGLEPEIVTIVMLLDTLLQVHGYEFKAPEFMEAMALSKTVNNNTGSK